VTRTRKVIEAVEVEVIPMAYTWESQAVQYAPTGQPGLGYERHYADGTDTGPEAPVDCLLVRDANGMLVGILNHYPEDDPGGREKAGNVNLWVHPDRRRRGIATLLLTEADARWSVDWRQQRYTEDGLRLLKSRLERVAERNTPTDEEVSP
jgi:ribosomal protein S18 acetylase RimI-like enzyme